MTDAAQPLRGLEEMTREELLALVQEWTEEGIRIGKSVSAYREVGMSAVTHGTCRAIDRLRRG